MRAPNPAYSNTVICLKKLLALVISLTLVISAFVLTSERPDEAVQAMAGDGAAFAPVNIIQFLRNLLR